ncbi:MAG: hypothetical protein Q8N05_09625, partial [Bacteroidota bacterium]|nr:hypothetical protein [Bacteroidota bacterium]
MTLQNITLISFGYFGKDILEKAAEAVNQEFNYPVLIKEGHLDLCGFFDPARRQYNGTTLLMDIPDHADPLVPR